MSAVPLNVQEFYTITGLIFVQLHQAFPGAGFRAEEVAARFFERRLSHFSCRIFHLACPSQPPFRE
jgi:hypothetical protein